MRRKRLKLAPSSRGSLRHGHHGVGACMTRAAHRSADNAVARFDKRVIAAVGAAHLRRLRNRYKKGGLGDAQPVRLFAEIGQRCRAHSLQIPAIRRKLQIERQNFRFGKRRLKAEGVGDLLELRAE